MKDYKHSRPRPDYVELCGIRAWHFVGETLRDGSPVPKDGVWTKYPGPLILCQSGLHASRDPFDALQYAPGATLCLVDCRGDVIEQEDKLVCAERRITVRMDATAMLRYFARMQALSCLHNWAECPTDVVLDYLIAGDDAASSAAWSAARSAAHAAQSAARSAAESAAWSAAWSAAESARSAARFAAESAAREYFNQTVRNCFADWRT